MTAGTKDRGFSAIKLYYKSLSLETMPPRVASSLKVNKKTDLHNNFKTTRDSWQYKESQCPVQLLKYQVDKSRQRKLQDGLV